MFDLELDYLRAEVKKRGAKRVLVQLPEGLMERANEIVCALDCDVLLWAKPCYGSCDVPTWAPVDVNLIVAYGHSGEGENVLFIEAQSDKKMTLQFEPTGTVGLLYTIQFRKQALEIRDELERKGHKVVMGEPGHMSHYPGQVTGCDIASARSIQSEVDCFLFVGEGTFHSGALALEKPVFDLSGERIVAKRKERHALVLSLETFGILVSIKPGQRNEKLAEKVKSALEKMGKTAYLIVGDDFDPRIANFPVDAFVTTACPRLADDTELFGRPILTAQEVISVSEL